MAFFKSCCVLFAANVLGALVLAGIGTGAGIGLKSIGKVTLL